MFRCSPVSDSSETDVCVCVFRCVPVSDSCTTVVYLHVFLYQIIV